MNAKEQLLVFKADLDKELKKYFDIKIAEAAELSPFAKEQMEHISDLTLRGGKRIRAALLYYSYLAHGGRNKKEALKAAMAMELSETFLLIHDDIMDNDSMRRGGETIHASYRRMAETQYHDRVNPLSFGNSIAILAGNIACALSNKIIADCKFNNQCKVRAIHELNKVYTIEQYGQMLDIFSEIREKVTKKDVILVHQLKTVPYTFDGPVKMGAILAGANEKALEKLSKYTVPLGTAFQIQDDILGMFGSEGKLGKPVTSDLKEGKKTLLVIKALEKANAKEREIIEINLGNKKVTINSLRSVRKVIEDTGSLNYSKKLAADLVAESMQNLTSLRLKQEGKDFLVKIADYMIKRDY